MDDISIPRVTSLADLFRKMSIDVRYQRLLMIGYHKMGHDTCNCTYENALKWLNEWIEYNIPKSETDLVQRKVDGRHSEKDCSGMVSYLNTYLVCYIDAFDGDKTHCLSNK